jgi:hypothetical protein
VGIFAIPAAGVSLFIIYLLIVFIAALTLVPAIVGSTKNDSFDTLFEVFSCTNEQTWRLLFYSVMLELLALVSTAVLGWFVFQAIHLGGSVVAVFMGDKAQAILSGASFYLHLALPSWFPFLPALAESGMLFGGTESLTAITVGQNIGAVLVGVAAYVVLLFVLGYAWAIWNVGQTLIFCVLVKKKDDKDMLTEKETEDLLAEETPKSPVTGGPRPGSGDAAPKSESAPPEATKP